MRNIITRMIAYPEAEGPPDSLGPITLQKGDLVLLFSDGMFALEEEELMQICTDKKFGHEVAAECFARIQEMISAKVEKHFDNFSMILFEYNPEDQIDPSPAAK